MDSAPHMNDGTAFHVLYPSSLLMRASRLKAFTVAAAAVVVALVAACGGAEYTQVTAGGDFSCGLRSDGSVICWGDNTNGQLRAPENERFTEIAAGAIHACGLKSSGTVDCWGYSYGISEDEPEGSREGISPPFPPEDEQLKAISADGAATCGIRMDGSVTCWVSRSVYTALFTPFDTEKVERISGGGYRICGLRSDNGLICYGLGEGPPEGERFASVSAASVHACGLRLDGRVACWGIDTAGQLSPPEDGPFAAIAAGGLHTCGLRENGSAVCWGYDLEKLAESDLSARGANGSVLDFLFDTERSDPPAGDRFTALTAGSAHTCGLREDGGISCWGYNHHGQATPP